MTHITARYQHAATAFSTPDSGASAARNGYYKRLYELQYAESLSRGA